MLRRALSLAAALLLAITVHSQSAVDVERLRAEIFADAEALGLVGGAVVIVDHGETELWTFGAAEAERQVSMDAETLFSAGSVAKPLTAYWLDQHGMNVDTTLSELWPELDLGDAGSVTVAQAVDQSSGFPRDDASWVGRTIAPADAASILRQATPIAAAGARFTYNSVIFALAADGAARLLGSALPWPTAEVPAATPFELTLAGDLVPVAPFDHGLMSAAVDARVSPAQLAALLPELLASASDEGALRLGGDAPERSCCPLGRSLRYANGWFIEQFEGYDMYSHQGNSIGGTAVIMVVPELELGVAVLVNQDYSELFVHAVRYKIVLHAVGADVRQANVLIRQAQAQRTAWAALAAKLGADGEPVTYGALGWPTAFVSENEGCRVVLRGPLLGQYIGADCTKP